MPGRIAELVFTGNNRSVVRALTEIADKSDRTASQVQRDGRRTSRSFDEAGKSAHRMRGAVAGLAGTIGLGGLAFGIKDVISAGETWQARQTQLQGALKQTGAGVSNLKDLLDAADRTATHGGFGAAENVQALTLFVTATKNATKAQRDLGLATDISRRTGKDFTTVTRAIMMLENGRTTGLSRLGLAIPKVTTAEDALKRARLSHTDKLLALTAAGYKFTAAQKAQYSLSGQITSGMLAQAKAQDAASSKQKAFAALQSSFGGATAKFSNTTQGRVSNLQNTWKSLQEQLGQGLLPVMNKILGVVVKLVGWLNKHKAVLYGVMAVTGGVVTLLAAHAIATSIATAATETFALALDALPFIAVIAAIVLLVTHFKQVQQAATIAWKWIKGAALDTFNWIKGHWPLLAGILLAPFTLGGSLIYALFHKQIIGAVNDVWKFIQRAASAIFNALTWPFREGAKVIKGAIGGISHIAGSVLNTATFGLLHGGGVVKPKYLAVGGGPFGTDTVPGWLTPGEGVVTTKGMRGIGGAAGLNQINSGQGMGGNMVIEPMPMVINLDGRPIYQGMVQFQRKQGARGASSLVGGAMSTGIR